MSDRYNQSEDLLAYLQNNHTGSKNAVPSAVIEYIFCLPGSSVRQMVNRLRCEGRPVCSDANGYFYAQSRDEIDGTVSQLLSRTRKINDAAQGLILSHQVFFDGTEGGA
jgi:hypothetical protein